MGLLCFRHAEVEGATACLGCHQSGELDVG
jgi:hypothetical protein